MSGSQTYRRDVDGRLVAGVCSGLARHLEVDPFVVRLAFVLLALASGIGVVGYFAFWVLVPEAREDAGEEPGRDMSRLLAFGSLTLGIILVLGVMGWLPSLTGWPVVLVGIGAALVWQQAGQAEWRQGGRTWRLSADGLRFAAGQRIWPRLVLGAVLVLVGLQGLAFAEGNTAAARTQLISTLTAVAGLAIVFAPWWLAMARELTAERRERIRSQERAEVAAHVHDSVLHTLTLIQRGAEDPHEVRRLARVQERELRTWLYRGKGDEDKTLAAAVEGLVAEVEAAYGVPFDVVPVGDCALDERLRAMLQATREAMVNAAKYAGPDTVSVFVEVEPATVTIFVRDRGPGFDPDQIPTDRLGVRESIIGRMSRNGGRASVRAVGEETGVGTEIELEMPRGAES